VNGKLHISFDDAALEATLKAAEIPPPFPSILCNPIESRLPAGVRGNVPNDSNGVRFDANVP
jgi:hypothetical protein